MWNRSGFHLPFAQVVQQLKSFHFKEMILDLKKSMITTTLDPSLSNLGHY